MKKTAPLLLFFMWLQAIVTAQPLNTKNSSTAGLPTDSVQAATKLMNEGLGFGSTDTARALRQLRTAAGIFSRCLQPVQSARCYIAVGDIYFRAGFYNRAFGNYIRAQDTLYETGDADLGVAMLGVAKSQYHRGLYRFAIKAFAEVIEYAVKHNSPALKAAATEYMGLIYFIFQSIATSSNFFSAAFATSSQLHDEAACLRLSEKLFDIHFFRKKYDSALWYADYTFALANRLNRQHSMQESSLNRIAALIRLHRTEEAWHELTVFEEVQVPVSDLNTAVRHQLLYADYFMAIAENDKAKIRFDRAIQMASAINTPDLLAQVYHSMADAFAEQQNYEKAYRYGLIYYEMMNDFYSNSISNLSKIESLIKEDIAATTIKFLNSTNKIRELQLLRELDTRLSLQRENRLKDSILVREKQLSQALVMENTYKSQQLKSQQLLSATLHNESGRQKTALKKEYTIRLLLTAALLVIFILGLIAWRNYRKTQSKNLVIEKQAADLQVLMKEIHHRVKNNLQIISSLLDIQSLSMHNSPAAEAIKEGRNRVQSMALIHQYLYQEDNIRGIWMEDYIKTLSENLFSSYNVNPGKITLTTDIDRLNLDVDSVIPLGLIINELVSNALKYAFTETGEGRLSITLKQQQHCLFLLVKDNGKGFPPGFRGQREKSFGLQLIDAFAQKLKSTLELYNENGAAAAMRIKKYKLA